MSDLEGFSSRGHRSISLNLGSYHSTSYPLLQPHGHRLVDPHVQQSMKPPNFVNTHVDPNLFFPPASLDPALIAGGQSSEEALSSIYRRLVDEGIYSERERMWIGCNSEANAEESTADLFNETASRAYAGSKVLNMAYVWRSHGTVLVESLRKPDVILVPTGHQHLNRVHFRAIQTYCELKYANKPELVESSLQQILDVSNHILATQLRRRFFVGMSLCGRSLSLVLVARGALVISNPLDIDRYPMDFLRILLGVTSCSPAWNGGDENFFINNKGLTLEFQHHTIVVTDLAVFISMSSQNRSSRVWFCHALSKASYPPPPPIPCILKDCWMEEGLSTDIGIHEILRIRAPRRFDNEEQRQKFGAEDKYGVFHGCHQLTAEWDQKTNLPGIPIILAHQEPLFSNPNSPNPSKLVDTTENILSRFGPELQMDRRKHIRLVYQTVGTPIVWFSCRRELINAIMGATIALFNGTRKNILHCDASDTNVMLVVENLEPERVVPDWPTAKGEYTRRAGVLFDWGYAQDQSPKARCNNAPGRMTGTFPFSATELLGGQETKHEIHHDLEALFWVMFITSVNLDGPFNKRRQWKDSTNSNSTSPFPFAGNMRVPLEPAPNIQSVPVWATPGPHSCGPEEVYEWKRSIPNPSFVASMSSYWTSGQGGKAFVDGMQELANWFRHEVSHDGRNVIVRKPRPITPEIFLDILYKMREGIPDAEDRPSRKEILQARSRYKEMLEAHCGLEAPLLDPPGVLARSNIISPHTSRRAQAGITRNSKRPAPPTQDTAARVKRNRQASPAPEASGSRTFVPPESSQPYNLRSKANRR